MGSSCINIRGSMPRTKSVTYLAYGYIVDDKRHDETTVSLYLTQYELVTHDVCTMCRVGHSSVFYVSPSQCVSALVMTMLHTTFNWAV